MRAAPRPAARSVPSELPSSSRRPARATLAHVRADTGPRGLLELAALVSAYNRRPIMPGRVCLDVVAGPIQGKHFEFDGHDTFLFGRSPDCHAELASDDATASRHHFLLEVNPPAARLRDLGSLNGTYVNGQKHGGREKHLSPEQAKEKPWPQVDLRDGDLIRRGHRHQRAHRRGDGGAAGRARPLSPRPRDRARGLFENGTPERGGRLRPGAAARARRHGRGPSGHAPLGRGHVRPEAHAPGRRGGRPRAQVFDHEMRHGPLRHPNVVTMLHGSQGDTFYSRWSTVRAAASGASRARKPLELDVAMRVASSPSRPQLRAEQGFIHRDIKSRTSSSRTPR